MTKTVSNDLLFVVYRTGTAQIGADEMIEADKYPECSLPKLVLHSPFVMIVHLAAVSTDVLGEPNTCANYCPRCLRRRRAM